MTDKLHHTQTPQAFIKRALDSQGWTHALNLSHIIHKDIQYAHEVLRGERALTGKDKRKLRNTLHIDVGDLG